MKCIPLTRGYAVTAIVDDDEIRYLVGCEYAFRYFIAPDAASAIAKTKLTVLSDHAKHCEWTACRIAVADLTGLPTGQHELPGYTRFCWDGASVREIPEKRGYRPVWVVSAPEKTGLKGGPDGEMIEQLTTFPPRWAFEKGEDA